MSDATVFSIPAGRMQWDGELCKADPRKGTLTVATEFEINRMTWTPVGGVEEEELLVVGDAYLKPIDNEKARTGRCYALKYTSSDVVRVFWLQSASSSEDEENILRINTILNCPEEDRLRRESQTTGQQ